VGAKGHGEATEVDRSNVVDRLLVYFGVLLVQTERRGFESGFESITIANSTLFAH
jgi:hypothetical protein